MRTKSAFRLLAIASASIIVASPAIAQGEPYSYLGLSLGQSRANMNTQTSADQLLGNQVTASSTSSNLRDTGGKIFLGRQFNPYWGIEGGYFDLGNFSFTTRTTPTGTLDGRYRMRGLDFSFVGTAPLGERWSASARIGAAATHTNAQFDTTGAITVADHNPSKRDINVKYGVGLQYAFNPSFMMRTEMERYRVNDAIGNHAGVNLLSVGLVFPFGRAESRARPVASAPAYMAPAPVMVPAPEPVAAVAPAPVAAAVMPAPPAPMKQRVKYAVEELFTFDESALRPEGQTSLDGFVRQLSGASYEVITVEGHTDRLGSVEYNQALSLRRAEKVKSYLVTSGGLMPEKIKVVGMSESQPVTRPEDCKGNAATAQLKACLQPDRRVEIEVIGTR